MTSLPVHHAYSQCIELWRARKTAAARELLLSIPRPAAGTAADALHRRLEAILLPGSAIIPPLPILTEKADAPAVPYTTAAWTATAQAPRIVSDAPPAPARVPEAEARAGVSLVAACMNRQHNLLRVLPSWLATSADEIVIVDWSSTEPLVDMLAAFTDSRIRIVRIDDEPRWILTHALNAGLQFASRDIIFKLDCDIELSADFIEVNRFERGEFARGFWKLAVDAGTPDQRYTNGTFGAFKSDLKAVGFFDERIQTYGWDDSDLYTRLAMDQGLAGRLIEPRTLRHIEQQEQQRTENQDVDLHSFMGRFGPTEVEGSKNKYQTLANTSWGSYSRHQEFGITEVRPGLYKGRRSTPLWPAAPDLRGIGATLAMRQLVLWNAGGLADFPTETISRLDFADLFKRAHRQGASEQLLDALNGGRNLHFVLCRDAALRPALRKTLSLIVDHVADVAQRVVVYEATPSPEGEFATAGTGAHVEASSALIELLADQCRAAPSSESSKLEETLVLGASSCTITSIDFDTLTEEIITKADTFSHRLTPHFSVSEAFMPGSVMVTSLYDEHNLIRLVEYLTCVVLNLRVFERVVICYESRDGILNSILRRLATRLDIALGRLVVMPFDARPTFEQLFEVRRLFPAETIIAAANADIAFDATFHRLAAVDMASTITVLSRWDVTEAGTNAALIRLDNGTPNTFSADAWITNGAFEPDFFLDYPIGTMHCDSFINHQVGLSAKYNVINPCLEVKVFHLHDERFNSSAQKQIRDLAEIQKRYEIEKARNGDEDPIRGVGWSSIHGAQLLDPAKNLQVWRPKTLVVDMTSTGAQLGSLLMLHLLHSLLGDQNDLTLMPRLRPGDALGAFGALLCRYQSFFGAKAMLIDFADRPFDAGVAKALGTSITRKSASELLPLLEDVDRTPLMATLHEFVRWPGTPETRMVRAEVDVDLDARTQVELSEALARHFRDELASFLEFADSLAPWSPERTLITPFVADLARRPAPAPRAATPRVAFVTSLYRGAAYLPEYLENVSLAAEIADGEVIIVDANVDDDEDATIVQAFLQRHPRAAARIIFVRLDADPGLYNCWKLAIERARAPLVTNANIDDRRSPWHTARLVDVLEQRPELGGACGSISCVRHDGAASWFAMTDNAVWYHDESSRALGIADLHTVDATSQIRSRNVMHCMPVWRKALHDRHGWFDEYRYGTSADWEFWLRCAGAGEQFWFERDAFGRYYLNPSSHNRRNDPQGLKEARIIRDRLGVTQSEIVKQ